MEIDWFLNRCNRYRCATLTWMMAAFCIEPRLPKDIVTMIAKMVYNERLRDDGEKLLSIEDVLKVKDEL